MRAQFQRHILRVQTREIASGDDGMKKAMLAVYKFIAVAAATCVPLSSIHCNADDPCVSVDPPDCPPGTVVQVVAESKNTCSAYCVPIDECSGDVCYTDSCFVCCEVGAAVCSEADTDDSGTSECICVQETADDSGGSDASTDSG